MDYMPFTQPRYEGYEVVVIFTIRNFENSGIFYTDSNGLEMQKRVLNHRDNYEFKQRYNKNNVVN